MQQVKVGSIVPHFTLPDQHGQAFDINSVLGKKNLVIYFYPKNNTLGCTKEACSFRDQYEDFKKAGAEIIGISSDGVESHKNFASKNRLNFTLLSDKKRTVRKLFSVPANFFGMIEGRATYVVNKSGKIIYIFNSQWQVRKHIKEALQALENSRDQ